MIKVPAELEQLLAGTRFAGPVDLFNETAAVILEDNKLPFFPAYTDHGVRHVEHVLETEVRLIPDEVFCEGILTPADAATLICVTILHDIALHLREDGFLALITDGSGHRPIPWFDTQQDHLGPERPWSESWDQFFSEAHRFSDHDLHNVFGPPDLESTHARKVRRLPSDVREWNDYDRLLIGEFLRRHHARLGHEIAFFGFPGLAGGTRRGEFPILAELLPEIADLAGLVARSHGLPLRTCSDYVHFKFRGDLRPADTVPVFHMSLVRVADYLQIEADRAPTVLLKLRKPQSRVSVDVDGVRPTVVSSDCCAG